MDALAPTLEDMQLCGNPISAEEALEGLAAMKELRILDMTECPVVDAVGEEALRVRMMEKLPGLEAFNNLDRTGAAVEFDEDVTDDDEDANPAGADGSSDSDTGSEDDEDSDEDEDESGSESDDEEVEELSDDEDANHDSKRSKQ